MAATIGIVYLGDGLFRKYMFGKYRRSLLASGARLRVLPWIKNEDEAERELKLCDGLLLPGGKDIDPELYGEAPRSLCGAACPGRDICEPIYFNTARKLGLPVLGICRGLQIINVTMGGSLWQDISLMPGEHVKHSSFLKRARYVHDVKIRPGSLLSGVCSELQPVNSIHHQCIKLPAPGLIPSAESSDGICEALEGSEGPFLLAVQWHPEHLFKRDKSAREIFRLFIEASRK